MYYLNTQVQLHVAKKFIHSKSAKEAWTILVNSNRGAANVRKIKLQELRRQFELAQMKSMESIKDFIGTIKEIVNDMVSNGENLKEVRVVEKVLRSLTAKFHTKKMVLEATKDLDNLSLVELEGELLTYEMFLNQQPLDTVEEVIQAKVDNLKGKEEVNHMDTNQRNQNLRGRGCGGRGNFHGHGRELHAKVAENSSDREETLLLSSSIAGESMKNDWFIDSGCSNHMYDKKEMFSNLDESFHAFVRFGNNEKVSDLRKGKIRIILQDGSSNFSFDVLYVPSLYYNLLSLGQLSEKGYDLHFKYGKGTISDEKLGLIAKSKQDPETLLKYSSISPIMGPSADKQAVEQVVQPHGDPSPSTIQAKTSSRPQRERCMPA
ncbi:uncharacterized protein [Coffea arabica]|uniref:Retrovirus-related Pol polyprotein from transposon TNT 1-94-like beta-barrel domain-containing protein n=1 Tax=Coffea arabica TaxID=13443 RepID=A0A6P6V060_COFAR|nr:uncharacterized protein LOC113715993 [Coffea arabica]